MYKDLHPSVHPSFLIKKSSIMHKFYTYYTLMARPRKSARKPTSRRRQAVGLTTNAQMGNSDSSRRGVDEDMQDEGSQQGEYQNGEPQQNHDTQHENNNTPQNTPDDSDSDATETEEQLQTIKTNWDITHLEEIIQDDPATWFKGKIDKDDDGHVRFEDTTIKIAYKLAKESEGKKEYVIEQMAKKWDDRDKVRVQGETVGANWAKKQDNMRIDFGRLLKEMRNRPAKDTKVTKRKVPKRKSAGVQKPPPQNPEAREEPTRSPEVDMMDANILNNSAELNQPNNKPRAEQQDPRLAPPPRRPDSPVQQGATPPPGPPPATQASARRPNKVANIQKKLLKNNQDIRNAEQALNEMQDAKNALDNDRGASAMQHADADIDIAVAKKKVRDEEAEHAMLQLELAKAKFDEEDEAEKERGNEN